MFGEWGSVRALFLGRYTGDRPNYLANLKKNVIRGFADQYWVACLPIQTAQMRAKDDTVHGQSPRQWNLRGVAFDLAGNWADESQGRSQIESPGREYQCRSAI